MRQSICRRTGLLLEVRCRYSQRTVVTGSVHSKVIRAFGSDSLPMKRDDNLPTVPIDFTVASRVQGDESQTLQINLEPGQKLRAESGAMLFMTQGIEMNTTIGEGGISSGFKRMLSGQNMFLSDFTYNGDEGTHGTVALGTDFPSKIIKLDLRDYGGKLVCQKGAFLAGGSEVQIELEFAKKMTTGFFGGEGFILQSLIGDDHVFIKAGGTLVKKELKPGESLRVSSGCLVAFTQDVDFDVQMMPGFKNVMFGGEGLFVTKLTGPGTVWLQGMPPDRMISEIARRVPSGGGIGLGIPIGMGGGGSTDGQDDSAVVGGGESSPDNEDAIAATDAAVDADRQATVASSGVSGEDTIDSESPTSLFGDAAAEDQQMAPEKSTNDSDHFGDETTFSSENESTFFDDQNFTDDFANNDETSFSTEDDFSSTDEFDSGDSYSTPDISGDEDGVGSILRKIWDLFNDD